MAQPPLKADVVQIEPLSGYTLRIERDSTTNGLKFTDPSAPLGVTLADISGVGSIAGVLIVGTSGAGAKYTSIQDALDAIPTSSSSTNPYVILLMPGVYTETLTWEKDGVFLQGFGRPTIQPSTDADTITFQSSVSTTPKRAEIVGVRIVNTNASRACVRIVGGTGSEVGLQGLDFRSCEITASGASGFPIRGSSFNRLSVVDCDLSRGHETSVLRVQEASSVNVRDCRVGPVQMDYSSEGSIPAETTSSYQVLGSLTGDIQSTLSGEGTFLIQGSTIGDLNYNGDRSSTILGANLSSVVVDGSSSLTLRGCLRGSLSGEGSLSEESVKGAQSFAASTSETVSFDCNKISTDYVVSLEPSASDIPSIENKTVSGFDITFPTPQTTTVRWMVLE